MKEYLSILRTVVLFKDVDDGSLETMLKCLNSEIKDVKKDEVLLFAGDKPKNIGVVLSGRLHIIKDDCVGNRTIIAAITPGGIFAEALCCAGVSESPVTVMADNDSSVMLLRFSRILHSCPKSCSFHTKIIENMMRVIANKNLMLQQRMEIVCLKSVREKVLRYLESFAAGHNQEFEIPFNREELANFLCVERSALSHELSRMKSDGIIEYKKNRFSLKLF